MYVIVINSTSPTSKQHVAAVSLIHVETDNTLSVWNEVKERENRVRQGWTILFALYDLFRCRVIVYFINKSHIVKEQYPRIG